MVHLILVSHSLALATGVYQLASQMTTHPENIHLAAGIDDPENPIGTDAVKIMAAIEEADNPDGILILIDLGSALLSAETALDLVAPDVARRCKISSAPLVEGAITAAISAGTGADLETVAQEAEKALEGKKVALDATSIVEDAPIITEKSDYTVDIVINNPHGLHARPAALLVNKMSAFHSQITLEKAGKQADGKNLNQILALGSRAGDKITFSALGRDAEAAVKAFQQLAAEDFGEICSKQKTASIAQATMIRAEKVSGIVVRPKMGRKKQQSINLADLKRSIDTHKCFLDLITEEVSLWLGEDYGEIFSAQKMLLEEMTVEALQFVQQYDDVTAGWRAFCHRQAEIFTKLENPYLQARAADIWDLENGVSRELHRGYLDLHLPNQPFIYVAEDIYPSQVWAIGNICKGKDTITSLKKWRLDRFCRAVVLAQGHMNSHAAILLKALNIPLFIQAGEKILACKTGEMLQVDLITGEITAG